MKSRVTGGLALAPAIQQRTATERSISRMHLSGNGPAHGLGILRSVKLAFGKFLSQLAEESLRELVLFFSPGCQGQQDFGKRLQITAAVNGLFELPHAQLPVAVNSSEPQHEARATGKPPDDVVVGSQCHVGVIRLVVLR